MFDSRELTIAYIKKRPESAGRTLASMPTADSAAFLREIPTRYAVKAVSKMNALRAAALVRHMGSTAGAALIRELGFAEASMILRQIDPTDRGRFLVLLPHRLKRDFETSLAFPTGTVGAHMTMAIATLAQDDETTSALDLVRNAERGHADVIFVVDDKKKLVGAVSASALLQHPARTPLSQLLDPGCVTLSAHDRLEAIADIEAWHDYSRLPVVTRRGEVFGTISRRALRASNSNQQEYTGAALPSLATSMVAALTTSASGLIDMLLESCARPQEKGVPHEH